MKYFHHDHEEKIQITKADEQIARHTTLVSIVINSLLTLIQIIVGFFSGSQALVADGIHTLSDLIADFIVLAALEYAKKAPDENHPYGHHRFENTALLVLGMLLLVVAGGMIWSAITKLHYTDKIYTIHIAALWTALFVLICKEGLFRYMLAAAERTRSDLLIANAWHARSDAASSLIVAIGIIGNLLGFALLDSIAALIVGGLIGKIGWHFTWNALNDLSDRAVSKQDSAKISEALLMTSGVRGIHDLRTRRMGSLIQVDVHLEVDGYQTVVEGHKIAVLARENVLMQCPSVLNVLIHVDPI